MTEGKMVPQKDNPKLKRFTIINTSIAEKDIQKTRTEELKVFETVLLSTAALVRVGLIIFALTIKPGKIFENLKQ